jgi:hypothetical protein
LERVHDIVDSIGCLQELLAAAPAITKPQVRISALGALWRLGTGVWSWRKNRKFTSKLLEPILVNRVTQVIDFEILKHNNTPELRDQWTKIRSEFQR